MRTRRYMKMEAVIANGDTGTIKDRWRYGRLLVCDEANTLPNGRLRAGVLDRLVAEAARRGYKVSRTELKYRIQAARAYPSDLEIGQILGQFENWWSLIRAGFPEVEKPENAEPYDPRHRDEREQDNDRALRRARDDAWMQMLPGFHTLMSLGEMEKRIGEKRDLGEQLVREADELQPMLDELLGAVDGDRAALYDEARDILDGANETDEVGDDEH